ncbi:MAG: thioredoxin family protein [Alteromonadaceae bacterium]|nr:thioredoxin family protein [Alteromonadaceae bacterium]
MRQFTCCIGFILLMFSPGMMAATQSSFYVQHDNEHAVLNEALSSARYSATLVAVVLGAEWCHDSRALADFMQSEPLKSPLNNIELVTIDVGFLENKQSSLAQFDYPAYFATPTLLLVDPATQQVVNRASLVRWQNAHNESAENLAVYLQQALHQWQQQQPPVPPTQAITAFENAQAEKLYQHYAKLGTLLDLETQGELVPTLNNKWLEVKKYRTRLQQDLIEMHQQGSIGDKTPTYAPISW